MKKSFVILTTASLLAVSSLLVQAGLPANARAETVYTTSLAQGTSSTAVTTLQTKLQTLGYFTYPTITGYYGSVTTSAVIAYQKDYGLSADGIAGPITLTSIDHAIVKKNLIADSYNYISVPYKWGGSSPTEGFDCSGFVYYMFNKFGISSVRTTSDNLYKQGTSISRASLKPGDLVFFSIAGSGAVDHVGFYVGNNKFISATRSAGIYIQSLDSTYWGPKYMGAKRVY